MLTDPEVNYLCLHRIVSRLFFKLSYPNLGFIMCAISDTFYCVKTLYSVGVYLWWLTQLGLPHPRKRDPLVILISFTECSHSQCVESN